ncbi:MAG: bifunctional ornithine acetyltransferase/N-acetylglutamate synthase [Candidatus Muproteobacteria bacterium RIFCSPHIGHO2_12_FULL_60_33]|uniref:Arginine biosynthesis bifunctional protein ArgJ n=1 Tax=Candidatus Muproteobacteria bacterium RIFCSPLOWO2_01_FULL_60_18 TaxID=1817768 RepID=A0A1F6TXW0_9PROT|nr:MAG: bifunctional ornithine acetyltransferase/N-acetylglutamate synthase [Candidatus Muproteobacteria bacterium RIFCSPLOWO2_01_FULL_60_18]OGI50589.1 MAG: bifunctional ornithine acetyltransferase/N-acetylglutamate synthase [Candidatus Muproteobacteria bacterium RIFCSPHIGHO2_01_60_12]OGI53848.1 MAG: bifunctional ornithine acetyltransferase/N-acetylglutamate synthase [Candidatus Muproteobacteria bacterium RIFCSPHIGHO2_02_FULL_60_13]OGI56303.1 MAG: bifunctional ornithine acetyltransferase/N-acety
MPVGLTGLPMLYPVPGIRLGTTAAGIRKKDRRDLVVIECAPGTQAAATFTQNRFCAAPITVARAHLAKSAPRALLINTGFANAGTGEPGIEDARACCTALASQLGCGAAEILPFSTGVIGERLPRERIVAGLPSCLASLNQNGWAEAAHGIMTTDTLPKGSSRQVKIGSRTVTVTGIAKGAGMIRPDMATMLAFVATDAAVAPPALQACVSAAVNQSFNRITVDGDTSTNDACVLLASGATGNPVIDQAGGEAYTVLLGTITEVFMELAQAIVRDAEGATKFITIEVKGGRTESDCLAVAYTIAHSPLVKTAFFASDPNWGRILAAIGRAPIARLDVAKVAIYLNELCVVRHGAPDAGYTEAKGFTVMRLPEIRIGVELGAGTASTRVWTSDLSHDYVRINAEYRS